jgi:hypothetical protein
MSAGRIEWQIPFVALPVVFGVFRSYQRYFNTEAVVEKPLAMAASAGR